MSHSEAIKPLLKHPALWQASARCAPKPAQSTGHTALDAALHYGGWPQGSLTELLLPQPGLGEWQLLAPLLARLSQGAGYVVLVNPPMRPYLPLLKTLGIDPEKLVVLHLPDIKAQVWAAYQALSSGSCSALLCWFIEPKVITTELRKLALGCRDASSWGFVFRPQVMAQQASVAALRLQLAMSQQGVCNVHILKQPGGWSGQEVALNLFPERAQLTPLQARYWPEPILRVNSPVGVMSSALLAKQRKLKSDYAPADPRMERSQSASNISVH